MVDWAIVGITFAGLVIVIAGIYCTGIIIGKLMDLCIDVQNKYLN